MLGCSLKLFLFPLRALHIIAIAVYKVEKIISVCVSGMVGTLNFF